MNSRAGFSLIELVIYIALFAGLSLASFSALSGMARSFATVRVHRDTDAAAIAVLERMGREIRAASYLDSAASAFGVPAGSVSVERFSGGATTTVAFSLESGRVVVRENAGAPVPLTSASVVVESLVIREISASAPRGVAVELELRHARSDAPAIPFYTTAILRGTY